MRKRTNLIIPMILSVSLCFSPALPVFSEENSTEEAQDETTDSEETSYAKGTLTENDYQSEWLNLKFTPPSTVVMNTAEELQAVMQTGQDTIEESADITFSEESMSGSSYEMMASSISGFPNVSLVVEDALLSNMTVDQYFMASQKMLDATELGYTYKEITDATIAEQDFRVMETSVFINEYEVIQKYFTQKKDGKFVSIILSYTADTAKEADEILDAFTPLN